MVNHYVVTMILQRFLTFSPHVWAILSAVSCLGAAPEKCSSVRMAWSGSKPGSKNLGIHDEHIWDFIGFLWIYGDFIGFLWIYGDFMGF